MSFPQQSTREASAGPSRGQGRSRPAWTVGMSRFAGILMIIIGVFNAVEGIVALFRNEVYVTGREYVFTFDLTTWGWVHLLIGVLVAGAGAAVLSGQLWGRIIGIVLATLSALANFLFIPYYPGWSLLIIGLNICVIWALCVVGRDAAAS